MPTVVGSVLFELALVVVGGVAGGRASASELRFVTSFLEGRRRFGAEALVSGEGWEGEECVRRDSRAECLEWSFARLRGLLVMRWGVR